jgi:AcrR family transcriptional regulator
MEKMMRRSEENDTRTRILEAALKTFSQEGYGGATTRKIAREAGVNEVTLFRHFGNKENLFSELVRTYSLIPEILDLSVREKTSFADKIRELTAHALHILTERKDLISILLSEGAKQPRQGKVMLQGGPGQVLLHLTGLIRQAQEKGEMKKIDPESAARVLMGALFTFVVFQKILPGEKLFPIDEKKFQKTFIEIFLHGVLPEGRES